MSWYTVNKTSLHHPTKRQQVHLELNDLIIQFFAGRECYVSAEELWLDMRAQGHSLSISSFYSRLKELVEIAVIEKKPNGYNKYVYKKINVS